MNGDWENLIEKELSAARQALKEGNDGKARACVRRAVGIIISVFNQQNPQTIIGGTSAVDKLRNLSVHASFPVEIQKAATRLYTNVKDRLSTDFTLHPLNDAQILIEYFKKNLRTSSGN